MSTLVKKVKFLGKQVKAFFPEFLPVGMTEFQKWSDDIVAIYNLPDNDSIRFALATTVLHLPSTQAKKAKRYFGLSLKKSMANQIAAAVMQDLKDKQQARIAAEATAEKQQESSDGSQKQSV